MPKTSAYHPFRSLEARDRYLSHYDAWSQSWPVPFEEERLVTSYGETFVRLSGSADSPPLVLLPGGRAPSLCWIPMIEALSRNFRTIAVDAIYDVGRSANSKPVTKAEDVVAWLDEVLDALGLEEGVNLMGLSLGGWVTAEYALHAPGRIAKVVWLSPAGVTDAISSGFILHGIMSMLPGDGGLRSFVNWIMPAAAKASGPAGEFYQRIVDDLIVSAKCFVTRPFPGGPRRLDDTELQRIDVPVLYLVGDQDRVCKDVGAAVSRANGLVPNVQTRVYPSLGHDLSVLETDAVTDRAVEFLQAPG